MPPEIKNNCLVDDYAKSAKLKKAIDFKSFYKGLADLLQDLEFVDIFSPGEPASGLAVENKDDKTRPVAYETFFSLADKGEGKKEYDIKWEAQKDISAFSKVTFTLTVECRPFLEKEINNKKLQEGKWEVKLNLDFKNTYGKDKIKGSFLDKKLSWLFDWVDIYYNFLYAKQVDQDLDDFSSDCSDIWDYIKNTMS